MRSDEGLRQLLDLMIDMAYSTGGAGFATVPPRNTYISDHMTVVDQHAHKTGRMLDADAWRLLDAYNARLWIPADLVRARERVCRHKWLKLCSGCGARYEMSD